MKDVGRSGQVETLASRRLCMAEIASSHEQRNILALL
jgi:hypothetical protein